MASVVDSTPLMAIEALETRLRKEAEEREVRLRKDLKAELIAELATERERRLKAERTVQQLTAQLRKVKEPVSEGEDAEDLDILADERCSPRLMEEVSLMAAPQDGGNMKRQSSQAILLTDSGGYRSLEHMQEGCLEGLDFDYKELPVDMWGVAIMTLTRDLSEISKGDHMMEHLTRFMYGMGCCIMNLWLQVMILLWVQLYVVGESVWTIQGNYADFHHDVFDTDGNFNETSWKKWPGPRDDFCGAVLTKPVFLGCILFLWMGRMLLEFKVTKRLADDIWSVPGVPADATLAHTILHRNDGVEIIGFTKCTRFMLYLIVVLPKFAICGLLTVIGLQWLTATESFADLILNALALEFVIGIDEQILQNFLPRRAQGTVEATKFAYPSKGPQTEDDDLKAMFHDYWRNIAYFCSAIGFTFVYLKYFQYVLPHFEYDIHERCGAWFQARFHPRCSFFEKGCFPFGNITEAHRYHELGPS